MAPIHHNIFYSYSLGNYQQQTTRHIFYLLLDIHREMERLGVHSRTKFKKNQLKYKIELDWISYPIYILYSPLISNIYLSVTSLHKQYPIPFQMGSGSSSLSFPFLISSNVDLKLQLKLWNIFWLHVQETCEN